MCALEAELVRFARTHDVKATERHLQEEFLFSEIQNNSRRGSFRGERIGVLDMVRWDANSLDTDVVGWMNLQF